MSSLVTAAVAITNSLLKRRAPLSARIKFALTLQEDKLNSFWPRVHSSSSGRRVAVVVAPVVALVDKRNTGTAVISKVPGWELVL